MAQLPEPRYAQRGDVSIAYQVTGSGPVDLIVTSGFVSHLDCSWEEPSFAHCLRRLATFCRLIRFDKRGTGLSDRDAGIPSLEQRIGASPGAVVALRRMNRLFDVRDILPSIHVPALAGPAGRARCTRAKGHRALSRARDQEHWRRLPGDARRPGAGSPLYVAA